MIRRDDVLRELNLTPVWRLRRPSSPGSSIASGGVADVARRARIATLAFDELVEDIEGCTACALCKSRDCFMRSVRLRIANTLPPLAIPIPN